MHIEIISDERITSLASNGNTVYVTTLDGEVFSKRKNEFQSDSWQKCLEVEPEKVSFIDTTVECGIGLTESGGVFRWTNQNCDEDSYRDGRGSVLLPVPGMLSMSHRIVQVSCGKSHIICLTEERLVGSWGSNAEGQLGLGREAPQFCPEPQFIDSLKGVPFVQVAAGGYHTVALTGSSAVFGWGRNSSGQLSLEEKVEKKMMPVVCRRVCSEMIRFVSCGDNHTAMLSKDGRLLSFGLPIKELSNGEGKEMPSGEVGLLKGQKVSLIGCGSQSTIAFVSEICSLYVFGQEEMKTINLVDLVDRKGCVIGNVAESTLRKSALFFSHDTVYVHLSQTQCADYVSDTMSKMVIADKTYILSTQENNEEFLKMKLQSMLSNASYMNGYFLNTDTLHHECSHLGGSGVDLAAVLVFFDILRSRCSESVSVSVTATYALRKLVSSLPETPAHTEALRMYLIIPFCHFMEDIKMSGLIVDPFINSLQKLNHECYTTIEEWIKNIPFDYFKRYLMVFKRYACELLLKFKDKYINYKYETVMATSLQSCLWLLAKLYEINETRSEKAALEDFHVSELSSYINIRNDFISSLKDSEQRCQQCRFCKFPFLYDQEAKRILLKEYCKMSILDADCDNDVTRHITVDDKLKWEILKHILPFVPELTVNRANIIEDTKQNILRHQNDESALKRQLRVKFEGEDAVGQGVDQEYFTVLFNKLLDPNYGLFYVEEESNLIWFKSQAEEKLDEMNFVGFMVGMALYNSKLINLQFPLALYKKLLNVPPTFEDFEELKPQEANYLRSFILDVSEGQEELDVYFDGEDRLVNNDNKQEYIDLRVDSYFQKSIEKEFESFRQGFCKAFDMNILKSLTFSPEDLREEINGNPELDVGALREMASYGGDYNAGHSVINDFWNVLANLAEDKKKWFLRFITGTDKIPHGGLQIHIEPLTVEGEDVNNLCPVVATCSNVLFLPCIADAERLEDRLLTAIKPKRDSEKNFTKLTDALGT